jgi:hypothetical protein
VQQYHKSADLGVRQVTMTYNSNKECYELTQTSPSGNYFPDSSSAEDSYCYALTSDAHAGIQVRSLCANFVS